MTESIIWSNVIDVATIVLSLGAVATAYFSWRIGKESLVAQERHNRRSLRPIPYIALADYEHYLRVNLVNDGAGPYIVKSLKVEKDNICKNDVISWMDSPPDDIFWSNFTSQFFDRGVLPNNHITLLELRGDPSDSQFVEFRDKCRLSLSKLRVTLKYTDIYDEALPEIIREFDWFARDKGTRRK